MCDSTVQQDVLVIHSLYVAQLHHHQLGIHRNSKPLQQLCGFMQKLSCFVALRSTISSTSIFVTIGSGACHFRSVVFAEASSAFFATLTAAAPGFPPIAVDVELDEVGVATLGFPRPLPGPALGSPGFLPTDFILCIHFFGVLCCRRSNIERLCHPPLPTRVHPFARFARFASSVRHKVLAGLVNGRARLGLVPKWSGTRWGLWIALQLF